MVSRFFTCCKIPAVLIVCMTLLLGGCAGKGTVTAEDTKIVMGTLARITVRADEIAAQAALRDGFAVLTQTEQDADGAALAAAEERAGTGEMDRDPAAAI